MLAKAVKAEFEDGSGAEARRWAALVRRHAQGNPEFLRSWSRFIQEGEYSQAPFQAAAAASPSRPTLIIVGSRDGFANPADAEPLRQCFSASPAAAAEAPSAEPSRHHAAELVVHDGRRHWMVVEHAALLAANVSSWLDRVTIEA